MRLQKLPSRESISKVALHPATLVSIPLALSTFIIPIEKWMVHFIVWLFVCIFAIIGFALKNSIKRTILFAIMILALIFIISYYRWRNYSQNIEVLKPKINIRLFLSPDTLCYPPPLRSYELIVENQNPVSMPIKDFRMEFLFNNIITEVDSAPLLSTGANLDVGTFRFCKRNPDGTVSRNQRITLSMLEKCTFEINKYELNEKSENTNVLTFFCNDWSKEIAYSATIVVDTNKIPELQIKPDDRGTYHGKYYYTINSKEYSEIISGTIPSINKDVSLADIILDELSNFNPNEGTIFYSTYDQRWLERNGYIIDFIPEIKEDNFQIRAYRDKDNIFKVHISDAHRKNVYLYYEDLEALRINPLNNKHTVIIRWNADAESLFIDGVLVDSYPKYVE